MRVKLKCDCCYPRRRCAGLCSSLGQHSCAVLECRASPAHNPSTVTGWHAATQGRTEGCGGRKLGSPSTYPHRAEVHHCLARVGLQGKGSEASLLPPQQQCATAWLGLLQGHRPQSPSSVAALAGPHLLQLLAAGCRCQEIVVGGGRAPPNRPGLPPIPASQ